MKTLSTMEICASLTKVAKTISILLHTLFWLKCQKKLSSF